MSPLRRLPAAVLLLIVSLAGYPGAEVVSLVAGLTPPPRLVAKPAGPLPWLHVAHQPGHTPYIADDQGRFVLLHGAIPGGLIDFWSGTDPARLSPPPHYPIDPAAYSNACPVNSATIRVPPLCRNDLAEMAALGFNSVRLPLSWSLLEPRRGEFSSVYLERVAQVVGWAREQGLYVILDMHQNAWSRYVGRSADPPLGGSKPGLHDYTGAPGWATRTNGLPSETFVGQREINPAVMAADTNFWFNADGIQSEYIRAVGALARRFRDESAVAGYSIFNEPWPGFTLPPGFEDLLLFPFYRRVIDAVTGLHDGLPCPTTFYMAPVCGFPDLGIHDRQHLFFLDTGLDREVTDFPTHLGLPVSSYPNLVLGIHAYTHKYTFDGLARQPPSTYPWGGYEQSYAFAEREARALRAALFVAEFGAETEEDQQLTASQLREQELHRTGFAFWTWKENCGAGSTWGIYAGIYGEPGEKCAYDRRAAPDTAPKPQNGCLRGAREALLARPYPRAVPGDDFSYRYDPATGEFHLTGRGGRAAVPLLLFIPRQVTGTVSGGTPVTNPDGSRTVTFIPRGTYSLSVSAAPLRLTSCKA